MTREKLSKARIHAVYHYEENSHQYEYKPASPRCSSSILRNDHRQYHTKVSHDRSLSESKSQHWQPNLSIIEGRVGAMNEEGFAAMRNRHVHFNHQIEMHFYYPNS